MSENKKDLEIITGDGNLNISPVYDHLNAAKPKCDHSTKDIIIPKTKEERDKEEKKKKEKDEKKS